MMDFFPMFATGLVASVHCVAMCGGLVLTYSVKDGPGGTWARRMATHGTYQGAKIASYMLVGLALGLLGSVFDVAGFRGWVTVGAGVFMVLLGANLAGAAPWLDRLVPRPPRALKRALVATRRRATDESSRAGLHLVTPLAFGLLTGLMPCGPLQAAELYAAGTGDPARGLVAMLGYGLGTAPLMLAFGTVSSALSSTFKRRMMYVSAAVVVVLGLVMLNRGLMLVGSPVTAQTVSRAVVGVAASGAGPDVRRGPDGVAEVDLVISDVRFVPDTLRLPAGEPVRLVVDRREDEYCSEQLAIPQLGVLETLAPFATTVIDVPATDGGTYTLTCGMGMMSAMILVGGAQAATGGAPAGLAALGLVGATAYYLRRRKRGRRAVRTAGRPAATTTLLGLNGTEFGLAVALIAAAAIAGLVVGGAFVD